MAVAVSASCKLFAIALLDTRFGLNIVIVK